MWEWRNGGRSQRADKELSGAPVWAEQEEGWEQDSAPGTAGHGQHGTHSLWHPSPSLCNRPVQDAKSQ